MKQVSTKCRVVHGDRHGAALRSRASSRGAAAALVNAVLLLGAGCNSDDSSSPDQSVESTNTGGSTPTSAGSGTVGAAAGGAGGGAAVGSPPTAASGGSESVSVTGPLAGGGTGPASSGSSSGGSSTSDAGGAPARPDDGVITCPTTNLPVGDSNRTITVDGVQRQFLVHVPPGYTGQEPVPVVFDFHGLGGSGPGQRNFTGWATLADREGFIAVFPTGTGTTPSWNVGRCCPTAADQGVDDVAFVRSMITELQANACIDSKRVFASGCSNGGGMSYKLACEAADVIAAIAPVDFDCVVGENNVPSCGGCSPGRPITEIQFRATNDALVAYEGGPAPIPPGMDFPGAESNLADWGQINQCTGAPQVVAENPVCQTFPSCGGGVETTLCTQQGGSHCGNYQSLDIVNVAWQAFLRSPLP